MTRTSGLIVLSLALLAATAAAQEGGEYEKSITRAQLPAAVERTVAAESRGATVKGVAEETEDGNTT